MKILHVALCTAVTLLLSVSTTSAQTVWLKSTKNPVVSPGAFNGVGGYGIDGAFDSRFALSPSVIMKDGMYRMWYVGFENYWTSRYTIGYAVSENGEQWFSYQKNPVLASGSGFDYSQVWLSVVLPDTPLAMYYSGDDGNRWRVGLATSSDGINWDKYNQNPVLDAGSSGAWDGGNVWGVSVVKISPTDYRMWYSGSPSGGQAKIGYATSPDGRHWTKYEGNPVLLPGPNAWDAYAVYVPRVVYVNEVFHMFYLGTTSSSVTQIGHATSTDGIHWAKNSANPVLTIGSGEQWDSYALIDHCVLQQGNTLKMWYGGRVDMGAWQIGTATSNLTSDVATQHTVPTKFELQQSYPNPFNPATKIIYEVPNQSRVRISIFDSLGRLVTTLVDEDKSPGTYSVTWNAEGMASGTYYYRLNAGGESLVQKAILLK
jgi:beta-1,2-mannobiose phosphorylase / 1,2-beta-oligomannan phosphorylase